MNELWNKLTQQAGVTLMPLHYARLAKFLDLLLVANQQMNLTRITDRSQAEIGHVGDALTLLPFLPAEAHRLVDVGSGGGVPGLILAIVRDDLHVTMIESTGKKARFLEQTATELGLTNVAVIGQRAEAVGWSALRQTFDVATARAVGQLAWLVEWCLPLVKKGGCMLAMKGQKINEELPQARRAIKLLGGAEPVIHPVELPGTEHHVIVQIAKIAPSDLRYPRSPTNAKGKIIGTRS